MCGLQLKGTKKYNLIRHVRKVHYKLKDAKCLKCEATFLHHKQLKKHMKEQHPDNQAKDESISSEKDENVVDLATALKSETTSEPKCENKTSTPLATSKLTKAHRAQGRDSTSSTPSKSIRKKDVIVDEEISFSMPASDTSSSSPSSPNESSTSPVLSSIQATSQPNANGDPPLLGWSAGKAVTTEFKSSEPNATLSPNDSLLLRPSPNDPNRLQKSPIKKSKTPSCPVTSKRKRSSSSTSFTSDSVSASPQSKRVRMDSSGQDSSEDHKENSKSGTSPASTPAGNISQNCSPSSDAERFDSWVKGRCLFRCGICQITELTTYDNLRKHVKEEHDLQFSDYRKQHEDIYATKEHYKCKICYRPVVWDRVKLTNHMSKEHKMSLEIYHRKHHFYYSNEEFH